MADWSKISDRGTVDDRRGSPTLVRGGLGLGGIALILLFTNIQTGSLDPQTVIEVLSQSNIGQQDSTVSSESTTTNETYRVFASTVLGSTNRAWTDQFASRNLTYAPPHFVLFRGGTDSGCGGAYAEDGPHYCPTDQTVYLDETFFDTLVARFGGNATDVAQAYVIGHEVGHHVQGLLNISLDSIALELQADCLAGAWMSTLKAQAVLAPDEIKNALDEASAVGDDNIQKKTSGTVHRETWTHGSSAQRVSSFQKGYDGGTLAACGA